MLKLLAFPVQFTAPRFGPYKLCHLKAFWEGDQEAATLASLCITAPILILLGLLAHVITPGPLLPAFSRQPFTNLLCSPWLRGSVLFPVLIFMVHKILTSLTQKSYDH